jgi:NADH dehydrogenase
LEHDNVVTEGARGLAELGIAATPMGTVLETYLYAYRPHGQYRTTAEAAQALRGEQRPGNTVLR